VLAAAAAVNAEAVLAEAAAVNAGEQPLGPVGAVVGATLAAGPGPLPAPVFAALAALRGPLLAPGLGAQGAQPADLGRLFGALGDRVLPSSSREVLAQGPDPARLRAAAARLAGACAAALGRPG
ncbi:MAG: orotidine 5'-phosphate decarboxylase, partial [Actinomycetota bacterium]